MELRFEPATVNMIGVIAIFSQERILGTICSLTITFVAYRMNN
jgi:hypothetical protein